MRYDHLVKRVAALQPKVILEVGTWNGDRARQFLQAAPGAKYFGFDLFEDATKATDAAEYNVKKHFPIDFVRKRLEGFDATLVKGNTRTTLPAFSGPPVNFAWIDGGHSVETIRSDWEAVKRLLAPGAEVWFDDYFTGGPDIGTVGCNLVVADLKHEIHSERDPVVFGGYTQMVRVCVS